MPSIPIPPPPKGWRWIRARQIVVALLTAAAVVFVLYLLWRVHEVLFLVFVSAVLAIALDIPVAWLSRHMPRGLATMICIVALLALLAGVIVIFAPLIATQGQELGRQLPNALAEISQWVERWLGRRPTASPNTILSEVSKWFGRALPFLGSVALTIGATIAVAFMTAFFTWQPGVYLDGMVQLVPPARRDEAREFLRRLHPTLRGWVAGTIISMVAMGVMAAVGLRLLGMQAWIFLGFVTFATEFIPYLGPILSGAIAVLFGLGQSPIMGLKVLVLFTALQEIEGHTLQPFVMKKAVHLQPALLIAWQLAMAAAFGVYGLLVATPLLLVIKVAVQYFYLERTLGETA